ncbi:MAG TPA: hypothetical protein VGB37_15430 [Candidatus Lokiarchaeia archaeon]
MAVLATITVSLVAKYKSLKTDGWTVVEVIEFLFVALKELVMFASVLAGKTGEEKADWVTEEFKALYWSINPDIPKVPDWIETIAEKVVINYLTPALVKLAYNKVFGKTGAVEKMM